MAILHSPSVWIITMDRPMYRTPSEIHFHMTNLLQNIHCYAPYENPIFRLFSFYPFRCFLQFIQNRHNGQPFCKIKSISDCIWTRPKESLGSCELKRQSRIFNALRLECHAICCRFAVRVPSGRLNIHKL